MAHVEQILLSDRPASRAQIRALMFVALALFLAFVATLPFRHHPLPPVGPFMAVIDTAIFVCDLLTAAMLFAQAGIGRSRALFALATGYLYSALILIPHALTFPGALAASGLVAARTDATIWLYIFWHMGWAIGVIVYALWRRTDRIPGEARSSAARMTVTGIAIAAAGALGVTLLVVVGGDHLLTVMVSVREWQPVRASALSLLMLVPMVIAFVLVLRGPRSLLDLWLSLALWNWFIELAMAMSISTRYTLGWYVGRLLGMLGAVWLLVMLVSEISRIYARLVLSLAEQQREREGRNLTLNAVTASIAHEAKQPLAAIAADAAAGLRILQRDPLDRGELTEILTAIESEGQRVDSVVNSIRSIYVNRAPERAPLDINALIRETVALMGPEFARAGIQLELELDPSLPPARGDRRQLQHVFLNLLTNAVEALREIEDRPRTVLLRTSIYSDGGVFASVEDSGIGFAPENAPKLFDTFFTTKPHGTGVGLLLCRSILHSHGGKVWAEPRQPWGARFQLVLPGPPTDLGVTR